MRDETPAERDAARSLRHRQDGTGGLDKNVLWYCAECEAKAARIAELEAELAAALGGVGKLRDATRDAAGLIKHLGGNPKRQTKALAATASLPAARKEAGDG